LAAGCGSKSANAPELKHYHLTGRIVALNMKDQTASIAQGAIPGWMDAMTMEYPVKSKAEFNTLHVGDKIQGTVDDRGSGDYDLSNIQAQASAQ
jgi:Cu/Ag efflux protein CusF